MKITMKAEDLFFKSSMIASLIKADIAEGCNKTNLISEPIAAAISGILVAADEDADNDVTISWVVFPRNVNFVGHESSTRYFQINIVRNDTFKTLVGQVRLMFAEED